MFQKYTKLISAVFIVVASLFLLHTSVSAQICSGKEDCENKIKEYEEKLEGVRNQKSSLSSQISIMNTKIDLAQVKIQNTQHDIEDTQIEIESLGDKIEGLNLTLDHLSVILLQKIVEGYKNRNATVFDILLNQDSSSLTNKTKYIQIAQDNDRKLALRTQQIKLNFAEQKNLREKKKLELEELEITLQSQKVDLDNQKSQKQALLTQTKSDEVKYQQLLSQALAEFEAIDKALKTGTKVGPVKKGDPIALVGNTGYPYCSTGAHLHFEVRKDGTWTNPNSFLSSQNIGGQQIGSGSWDWPLKDPIILTQPYGITPYSWRYSYSGGVHTGLDMVSDSSDVIRAVADGTLYTSSQNCSGATIKIKYIEHEGGLISFYLHVQ